MTRRRRLRAGRCLGLAAALGVAAMLGAPGRGQEPDASGPAQTLWTPAEVELALELSPLPEPPPDPTNAWYEDPAAAALGQALFYDRRFSADGRTACATCHDPSQGWTDGRRLAKALAFNPRNTMSLWNVAYNRWFYWDGRKDTLWSQALAPFEDPREHGFDRVALLRAIAADEDLAARYAAVFGPLPDLSDGERFPDHARPVPGEETHAHARAWAAMAPADREEVDRHFARVGKAIAAFERQIVSRDAPFDRFVAALRGGDPAGFDALPESAQRGFALFVGEARCLVCHDGPNFTDGEFHSNLFPAGEEGGDLGRPRGVRRLLADPFNASSRHADDDGATGRVKLAFPPRRQAHPPGEFKTPGLRNVARTAPYMHEGQVATLADVVRFYSTLEGAAQPGPEGERILRPLHLSEEQQADLVAFLEALTDESLPPELLGPPAD